MFKFIVLRFACTASSFRLGMPALRFENLSLFSLVRFLAKNARGGAFIQTKHFIHDVKQYCLTGETQKELVIRSNRRCGIHNRVDGGDRRDRTDDLKLAKLPLSQLSYVPSLYHHPTEVVGLGGLEPPTSRLSSARSNQLSYRPMFLWRVPELCYVTLKERETKTAMSRK